jgi:hypothetical protein
MTLSPRGLKIDASAADAIKRLDEAQRNYWARYPRSESGPIFAIEDLIPHVLELLEAVAGAIRGPNTIPLYVKY